MATSIAEAVNPLTAVILDGGADFFVEPVASAIANIGAPTVAVIRGRAYGPAWELALACDLRIAREDAVVGSPELL
jgi:enoyl-CoA hydratase/carnithine racemase